jgi:hypothetical protein
MKAPHSLSCPFLPTREEETETIPYDVRVRYDAFTTPGGCQVPSPAGRIEGGVCFGQ